MTDGLLVPCFPIPAVALPAVFQGGAHAEERFFEFFGATLRNPNTRTAYLRAVLRFGQWCDANGIPLAGLRPLHVAGYIESLGRVLSKPSVKQHLAALRMLLDYLVTGGVLPFNPAAPVRGPLHVVKHGKTPVLSAEEARALLDGIDTATLVGKRDRALLSVLLYSFARVGAAAAMNVGDYAAEGRRAILRLHEKGGKQHAVPCHHQIELAMDDYLTAAGIAADRDGPLFRTFDSRRQLTANRLTPREALAMVKRRAKAVGFGDGLCCHSFRATSITLYRRNGGTLENAAAIAAHESTRTTQLYDRSGSELSLAEIERIRL